MIDFFAKHPTAANLLMIGIAACGLLSLGGIRRETFPDFQPREVEIRVPYAGATALDVEEGVCQRIEDALDGVRFVEEVRCDARDNVGVVTVEMVDGGDWSAFKDEVDTAIAAIDDFPERTEEPVIQELHTTDLVFEVLLSGETTAAHLRLYAEDLKDRLQQLPEVGLVTIVGFSDHQLRVELDAEALIRHEVSPSEIAGAIARQSVEIPAGVIEASPEEVLVRFDEERTTADQLADLVVVASLDGAEIRLRDLGTVVDDFELAEEKITHEGNRAAILRIEKTKSEDVLIVADAVKQFLDQERKERPAVDLIITQDISKLVRDRLGLLVTNGWQGMLLVFVVMWLFFNSKLSFWVVAALPVSFLGAFFFLPPLDLTINMLSMVGLLLAIGILMDDGIVIAENIARHREMGKAPLPAAVEGVGEVAGGVFSSFLTTACALGPLAFLSGKIGRILEVVPIVLLLVLAVSLVEAFLILPSHLGHSLHEEAKAGRFRKIIDDRLQWAREHLLGTTIDRLILHRYLWVGAVFGTLVASLALPLGGVLQFTPIPELEGDTVVARVLMPQGTPLERTEGVANRLVSALREVDEDLTPKQPKQRPLVQAIYTKFNENADAFESGTHVATVYADLLAAENRSTNLDELYDRWRAKTGPVADAIAISFTDPAPGPGGRNIELRVRGKELDEIRAVALEMKRWLDRFPGVNNLTVDLRPGKREFRIRFRPGTLGTNLDGRSMANQLRAAFQGEQAAEIQVGSESYEIEARFDRSSQDALADLERFRFTLPDGQQVPLSSVATITETRGWSRIARVDDRRTATLRGDVDNRKTNTTAVLAKLQAELLPDLLDEHPGVLVDLEGQTADAIETGKSLRRGLLIGVIGIFILLSFQFRSYIEPLIVMTAIPMALIGVLWGHLLMGYDITLPSILGFISLAGIVVNDSILLVLFLKAARARGDDPLAAATQASRDRFRAILMTSATTIVGLLPLMFETSLQAQVLIPLVVSVVFGLLTSTLLVLLVVPCLYVMLDDLGLTQGPQK